MALHRVVFPFLVEQFSDGKFAAPELSDQKRGMNDDMLTRATTLFAGVALCCSAAALAQEQAKTPVHVNDYSVARESALQGKVVEYSPNSTTAPMGAHVKVQTFSGVIDVHLGNAHLLAQNKLSLEPGDAITITGENIPFGGGTIFAARVITKGATSVTLRSKNGMPLLITPRTANGQLPTPAGAR